MKKLIYIATADDGAKLYIGHDRDNLGFLICVDIDSVVEPFITPNDPAWLENKFGKEVVEEARQVMDYIIRRSNDNK